LQQGEAKFPIGGAQLLSLCRQLRNPASGGSAIIDVRAPVCFLGTNSWL
jgi:hypothetical protein